MNRRDSDRLLKFDEQIMELELLYAQELTREEAEGKYTLLVSRAFKHRIDKLRAARTAFVKRCGRAPDQNMRFGMELAKRRAAVTYAENEHRVELQRYTEALNANMLTFSLDRVADMKIMAKLVNMKARTVQQKKLAVERWLEKSPRDLPAERVYLSEELQKAQQLATLNASAKVYAPVSIQDQDEITRAALAHINRDKTVLEPLAPVFVC
jgi:hypothetical protein